jgi:putative alpha-1,2-mannosidase
MRLNKHIFSSKLWLTAATLCTAMLSAQAQTPKQPVDYVNNFIGVLDGIDATNCVIGPQWPFGSINPSPQTKKGGNDGYNPNEPIRGFGQLHVSGTGWGTNGQVFISPQIGLAVGEADHDSPKANEKASPYEYPGIVPFINSFSRNQTVRISCSTSPTTYPWTSGLRLAVKCRKAA